MSYDRGRKVYRDSDMEWEDYRRPTGRKRSRSRPRDKRRSPRKEKDLEEESIGKMAERKDLWDSQYQDYPVPPPPPSFQREPSYGSNYQQSYSGVYDEFPPLGSAPPPPEVSSWNQMALPPPPQQTATYHNPEDQLKKEAAIESEMRHQKAALSKQREEYIKKSVILKKELDTLKDQRNELRGDPKRSPSPDTKRFLKENTKLQLEIQNKLKTINNVVDMLNGIIGEEAQELPVPDASPERKRKSRSPSTSSNKKVNYIYYDPEMHWCRVCNEFPPTAKDYLNHLHSAAHHKVAAQHMEAPWHSVSGINEGFPSYPSAPTKRTPIRGLQFFVPSTAWYCKLCDQFIGDLHCASAHLKSVLHSKNYTNFVEQNPHWETDWMSDRQKALEQSHSKGKPAHYTAHTITFSKDGFHTKRPKKSPSPQPEEKKKKKDKKKKSKRKRESSSSSSSQSDSSGSDHKRKKKDRSKRKSFENMLDEKILDEWMISQIQMDRLSDSDRRLLDTLKSRIKKEREEKNNTARDIERVKEMQRKHREGERAAARSREERRSRERDSRRDDRDDTRDGHRDARERWERHDKPEPQEKKPEIKKMPFIGKMPVFKHLGKTKAEELKKEEQKKKEDAENLAKKKQELDAEVQRKVAQFKEKIAAAQQERQQGGLALPPPSLVLPQALGAAAPPPVLVQAPHPPPPALPPAAPPALPPAAPPPAAPPAPPPAPAAGPGPAPLPKDFQEALDIIFPTQDKNHQDMYRQQPPMMNMPPNAQNMPPNSQNMPPNAQNMPYPSMGMMQQQMYGYDMQGYPPPQLYDSHVPMMPSTQPPRPIKMNRLPSANGNKTNKVENDDAAAKKKEELDELAMLGIDASDVGAGM